MRKFIQLVKRDKSCAAVAHNLPPASYYHKQNYYSDSLTNALLIPRLHDQANVKQPSSKCIQNTRARRVLYIA